MYALLLVSAVALSCFCRQEAANFGQLMVSTTNLSRRQAHSSHVPSSAQKLFVVLSTSFVCLGCKMPTCDPKNEAAISECRYAIASYLLQSKDRHNGNILIDTQGRLVHIDFGFILEISPGANMRFESAAFKLSHEMTQLLDPSGQRDSSQFHLFEELCVRGFLAVSHVGRFPCAPPPLFCPH